MLWLLRSSLNQKPCEEMLLQGGSQAAIYPNGKSKGRRVPLYPTRLNTSSETTCIQREEPGEEANWELALRGSTERKRELRSRENRKVTLKVSKREVYGSRRLKNPNTIKTLSTGDSRQTDL